MDKKFENIIKSKLQDRKITPSPNSWEKLEGLLDSENESQKAVKYRWLSIRNIAAVFALGVIAVSLIYMNTNHESNNAIVFEKKLEVKQYEDAILIQKNLAPELNQPQKPTIKIEKANNHKVIAVNQPREEIAVLDLGKKEIKVEVSIPNFDPKIDAQNIINEEINRLLVNSINPKINSALISEVRKLDLALLIEELNQNQVELESQFRKKVVNTLNSIYAQLSEKNIIKE
jgi:hypothetical protein